MPKFNLGSLTYSAPDKIGAWYRSEVTERTFAAVLDSKFSNLLIDTGIKLLEKKDPKKYDGVPKDLLKDQIVEAQYFEIMSQYALVHPNSYQLIVLETILTPDGDYTVLDGMKQAEEGEVMAVINFFTASVQGKTSGAPRVAATGKALKARRK